MTAYLNRIGTAVPPFDVHGKFVRIAPALLVDERLRRLFHRMAERCQIEHRWSFLEPEGGDGIDRNGFYRWGAFPATGPRMRFYERHAPDLAAAAVEALDLAGERERITHVIVATCTGFSAPGLDLHLTRRFGLRPSVERTTVGFMGCHAAINVLKLARHIVRSAPQARVLVVMLELCTLHFQESPDLETVLSFLIFGDGCAAGLVSAEPSGIALDDFRAVLVPDTEAQLTWRIGDYGFDMHLSGAVPSILAAALPDAMPDILDGRARDEIELWAVHPGGRSVLDAVEQAIGLESQQLDDSRAVLRDYGNMSSATVMFVLQRMLSRYRATGIGGNALGCAMAFGPGMVAETMTFHIAA